MKEKLLNNLGLKILSLVFAFIVWMAIVNISNPTIVDSKDVTVEVRNGDVLEAASLTYEIVGKDVVTVSYRVRTRNASLISKSDFHAYIDLKDYNVTGSVPVTVEVDLSKENLINTVTAKPMVIRVTTEALQNKKFDLQTATKGEPEEGYAVGSVSLSPGYVYVRGPESSIGQINSIGIEINTTDANADLEGTTEPVYYDANGNKLELGDKVVLSQKEIGYGLSILKAKNLNLNFEVKGTVADGFRFTGVECEVKSVPVVGTKSVLANISTLSITDDKLNVDGAGADKTVRLDLSDYLPPSTSIAGDMDSIVTVTLKVEPLVTRTLSFAMKDLAKQGSLANYDYTFSTDKVDVTVKGLKEDLDTLEEMDLNPAIDVDGLNQGTYQGKMIFDVKDGFEITEYSEFTITVISKTEEDTDQSDDAGETKSGTEASNTGMKKKEE